MQIESSSVKEVEVIVDIDITEIYIGKQVVVKNLSGKWLIRNFRRIDGNKFTLKLQKVEEPSVLGDKILIGSQEWEIVNN